jgi:hypothetical protein
MVDQTRVSSSTPSTSTSQQITQKRDSDDSRDDNERPNKRSNRLRVNNIKGLSFEKKVQILAER